MCTINAINVLIFYNNYKYFTFYWFLFRQVSGANIKISNTEEGLGERKVTISGTLDSINAAQILINTRLLFINY